MELRTKDCDDLIEEISWDGLTLPEDCDYEIWYIYKEERYELHVEEACQEEF